MDGCLPYDIIMRRPEQVMGKCPRKDRPISSRGSTLDRERDSMSLQTQALVMSGVGALHYTPPNALQPKLADGIHLRWTFKHFLPADVE